MKAFVRKIEEDNRCLVVMLGILGIAFLLAGEATHGLAYLPLYVVLLVDLVKRGVRRIRKRTKALLGADRSKSSR